MRRRELLGAYGVTLAGSLAGCVVGSTPLVGTATLDDPERETGAGGRETYLTFERDGERIATVGLLGRGVDAEDRQIRFRVHVSHADHLRVDRLRYRFRVPAGPGEPHVDVYYRRPDNGEWPPVTFHRQADLGGTVFEMSDLGRLGRGSVTLDFLAVVRGDRKVLQVVLDALVGLSGRGPGSFEATGTLEHEFDVDRSE